MNIWVVVLSILPCIDSFLLGDIDIRASLCRICDDSDPQTQCSDETPGNGGFVSCKRDDGTPYCMSILTNDGSGIKAVKKCASKPACQKQWWQATSQNPSCSQSNINGGNLATGVTCTFCCAGIHCNNDNYPIGLLKFTDIVVPRITTSAPHPTTIRATTHRVITKHHTQHHSTTKPTTAQVTTKPTHHHVTKSTQQPTSNPVTTPHSYPQTGLPTATVCMNCTEDPNTGSTCDLDVDVVCKGHTPYCLTSYFSNGASYRVEKKCSSLEDCRSLWWDETSQNPDCFRDDLLTSTGSRPSHCHYCCHAEIESPRCNKNPTVLVPSQLLLFAAVNSTNGTGNTSTSLTTKRTVTTTSGPSSISTTATTTSTTTTAKPSTTVRTTPSTTTAKPLTTIRTTQVTTTSTTTSTATTISPKTTPTTTNTSTAPTSARNKCQVCSDGDNSPCNVTRLIECPDDKPFCINTVALYPNGKKQVTKKCASDILCYSDWWKQTRIQAICMHDLSKVQLTMHGLLCKWCCENTSPGMPCNRDERPAHLLQYNDITTTASTSSVTSVPSSSTLSTSNMSTAMVTPTKVNTAFVTNTNSELPSTINTTTQTFTSTIKAGNETTTYGTTNTQNQATAFSTISGTNTTVSASSNPVKATTANVPTATNRTIGVSATNINTNGATTHSVAVNTHDVSTVRYTTERTTPSHLTTQATTSTTLNQTTSPSGKARNKCQVCSDGDNSPCNVTRLIECPDDKPFCINTVALYPNGKKQVTKECASDILCYSDWWKLTRIQAICMHDLSKVQLTMHGLLCKWCCENTSPGMPCNRDERPAHLLQYNDITTTASTSSVTSVPSSSTLSTSNVSTAMVTPTATSNPVKATTANLPTATNRTTGVSATNINTNGATTHSVAVNTHDVSTVRYTTERTTPSHLTTQATTSTTLNQTTSPSGKGSVQCWDCSNGCPFIQNPMTCDDGYCLTTVKDDSQFTRTIRKTCANVDECYRKWWLQTSDLSICVHMLGPSSYPTGVNVECNFCCTSDNCNQKDFPPRNTLFKGD